MLDLIRLASADKEDDLKEIKLWLFQENVRIQNEKKDLQAERAELEDSKRRFIKERAQFRDEMNSLNHRMTLERKRIKDENLFFEKKLQILQDGFRQLEIERNKFEADKIIFESKNKARDKESGRFGKFYKDTSRSFGKDSDIAEILFSGVNNPLGLKKRYRDLIKIFHPDNMCGDANVVQIINQEYERREEYNKRF